MKTTDISAAIASKHYVRRGRAYVFGPGKADLLERIRETGSIAEAAKAMGMSYMRAWQLVKSMNRCWKEPLVTTARGGSKRGGSIVTETGLKVLDSYRELEAAAEASTKSAAKKFNSFLK